MDICLRAAISIHAPRTGSDVVNDYGRSIPHAISIHAPRTGSDRAICRLRCRQAISIHAPRTGSDGISRARRCAILPFQSTLPARGATSPVRSQCSDTLFQSTLPARGATFRRFRRVLPLGFQSTLPARGATGSCIELFDAREISIHAPRTGSDDAHRLHRLHRLLDGISIHAPRTGSDQPSCRPRRSWHSISIHAPRTGSDKWTAFMSPPRGYFNPRSPHGERPVGESVTFTVTQFQSTLPARGATGRDPLVQAELAISIHAPRTGSDVLVCDSAADNFHFNPRSPHGERRRFCGQPRGEVRISIHAPRTGSDAETLMSCASATWNFNPRSPHGERRHARRMEDYMIYKFQSTLPARGATVGVVQNVANAALFQSTLPARGATKLHLRKALLCAISIHAPRTGSDQADGCAG